MATLDALKLALRQCTNTLPSIEKQSLTDAQYSVGYEVLTSSSGWLTYENFIVPQLSHLMSQLLISRTHVSILEVGPGPKSVCETLPLHLRQKIKRYVAFEPNSIFATELEDRIQGPKSPLVYTACLPTIHRTLFTPNIADTVLSKEKFDIVLFCHSMYGIKPKRKFIETAMDMLVELPKQGFVVVFHRNGVLDFGGLVCHRTTSSSPASIHIPDNDNTLNSFIPFITGYTINDPDMQTLSRRTCRNLGSHAEAWPEHLQFNSHTFMTTFTRHATALQKLTENLPVVINKDSVKNREARLHWPAAIVKPTNIQQIQQCVDWAREHETSLTVIGGGHSDHCLWPNVIALDMRGFNQTHVIRETEPKNVTSIVVEAGCTTEDIIRDTMAAGVTVPLGSRPGVGAGLWLQGGIGHLSRLYGLTCDAIIGAVIVSVASGKILCIGKVPTEHQPPGAVHPENEEDLLWAIQGAGTNFGIVVSVNFRTYQVPTYVVRNWIIPLKDDLEAQSKLYDFNEAISKGLPRNCSADAYIFGEDGQLQLGVTTFEVSPTSIAEYKSIHISSAEKIYGKPNETKIVDGINLFDTEMYMSEMHGGHASGKTSSFKRCVFLKDIGSAKIARILIEGMKKCPSSFCYFHLLQGGGAIRDIAEDASAFGSRDWDYACVVTGIWPREEVSNELARDTVQWVYNVANDMLPSSCGVYGSDLGPDPRDAMFAAKTFGPNLKRLAILKQIHDPKNVLAYACPLVKATTVAPKLILLITGEHGVGKDYAANIWKSLFQKHSHKQQNFTARVVSISDTIKREYATKTGANIDMLLSNDSESRDYKERHRSALTDYFNEQKERRALLPEKNFLTVVHNAADVDVLFITGMRDDAPVAAFSHLVPESRLLEVRVTANHETQRRRRGLTNKSMSSSIQDRNSRPDLVFDNETDGLGPIREFAHHYLLPLLREELEQLDAMVRSVFDFPQSGMKFRHILDIVQKQGGLSLCTSLLQEMFLGDWDNVTRIACCEAGGFVFASALAARVNVPLLLIRKAGKLPPPTVSVTSSPSHISLSMNESDHSLKKEIEMNYVQVPKDKSILIVDDVLATGQTLCATLQLLAKAGINLEDIHVFIVAEFPMHKGRVLLRDKGLGRVNVQSLLVFSGA